LVRNARTISVGRPEGKSTLGRPRYSWENNMKMPFNQGVSEDTVWIYLSQEGFLYPAISKTFGYHYG
jgi:hypothetical protein